MTPWSSDLATRGTKLFNQALEALLDVLGGPEALGGPVVYRVESPPGGPWLLRQTLRNKRHEDLGRCTLYMRDNRLEVETEVFRTEVEDG